MTEARLRKRSSLVKFLQLKGFWALSFTTLALTSGCALNFRSPIDGSTTKTSLSDVSDVALAPELRSQLTLASGVPTYDFGSKVNGTSQIISVTLTNSGAGTALLGTLDTSSLGLSSSPFSLLGGTCSSSASIEPSATCTLTLSYAPSTVGAASKDIVVPYTSSSSESHSYTFRLMGTSVAPASLSLSDGPGSYDYGNVGNLSSASKTFTVTNTGATSATLGTVSTAGLGLASPFSLSGTSTCATAGLVAAAGSCTLVVAFDPTSITTFSDSIDLSYNDGANSASASRGIQGTSVAAAFLSFSDGPGSYDYGSQLTSTNTDKTFTVTNSGGVNATLGTVTTGGLGLAAPFTYQSGTCVGLPGGVLNSGGTTCTIVVRYSPSATGTLTDSIDLSYNNSITTLTASRAVSGTGVGPAVLTLSDGPGSYDYGNVALAASSVKTFTVSNTGGYSATLGTISTAGLSLAEPYSFSAGGSCASAGSVAAAGSCTLAVRFLPIATGVLTDTLVVSYNDGTGAQTVSRGLAGTGQGPTVGAVQAELQALASAAGSPSPRAAVLYASPAPDATYLAWLGGVLYYNSTDNKSYIYTAPSASSRVGKLDIATGAQPTPAGLATTGHTNGQGSDWAGGVLAQNGYIYFSPNTWPQKFLKLDPQTETLTRVGSSLGSNANDNFLGAVMASDGMIYAIPYSYSSVVKLDPSTDTTTLVGSPVPSPGTNKWQNGALAFNGKIYAAPETSVHLLTIDPTAPDASKVSYTDCSAFGCADHTAFVVAPNGNLYAAPSCQDDILKLNPTTGVITTFSDTATTNRLSGNLWCGKSLTGAVGTDGKIYFLPGGAWGGGGGTVSYVLVVDPATDTVDVTWDLTTLIPNNRSFWGLVSAPDGNLYGVPHADSAFLVLTPGGRGTLSLSTLLSPWINKL